MANLRLIPLAILVGLVAAVGCICFHLLIEFFTQLFFGVNDNQTFIATVEGLSTVNRILIPTFGGFLVGFILTILKSSEAKGEGVPQVLKAVIFNESKIKFLVAPAKILTTAITLGSGGSAGREGPIVQIGSAIGSGIGQLFKQNESTTRLLLAAGAAAGIGGTFGAPIAGVLFSLELILRRVSFTVAALLLLAAVISDQVTSQILGFEGLRLSLPLSFTVTPDLLLMSVFIGVLSGFVAVIFGYTIRLSENVFHSLKLPFMVVTTIGGFLIGLLGLLFPYIHEPATYPLMIDLLSFSELTVWFLVALLGIKIIATAITLGSGGSGGVLAPSLLVGLIFGTVLSYAVSVTGLFATSTSIAFGLVGMAGVFAGVTHAPLTAIFLLYEITNEPLVIPLLFLSTILAYVSAKYLRPDSVYTEHITKRRIV